MTANEQGVSNEQYPDGWIHATIHLNPETGEMYSEGDHSVREWLESRIAVFRHVAAIVEETNRLRR